MYIDETQCCAVMEIGNLQDHKTAKEAMLVFCRQELFDDPYSCYYREDSAKLSGLYTFTGVIKHTDRSRVPLNGKYGPAFATLIRRNHLGRITESISARNRRNHPTHVIRVWVWAPSERNLRQWYNKNKGG